MYYHEDSRPVKTLLLSYSLCGPCKFYAFINRLDDDPDLFKPSHQHYHFYFNQGRLYTSFKYCYPENFHRWKCSWHPGPMPRDTFNLRTRWITHNNDDELNPRMLWNQWPPN